MDELACWLALARAPAINRLKLELLSRFPTVTDLFAGYRDVPDMPESLRRSFRAPDQRALESDRAWLASSGCVLISLGHRKYPPLLAAIDDAPVVLFVRGDPGVLSSPQIAIVGSRNPSPGGREHALAFGDALARLGLTITSGLAIGIDAQAHRAALRAGCTSVAVAGNGLGRVYPAANAGLAEGIARQGALVSEFPPGAPPRRTHFPRRNRIISGLSLGTLVVEAAPKSGSLITARLAAEQGREVFAVPGSIDNPLTRGCHQLIRDGAKLVESVDDVVSELGAMVAGFKSLSIENRAQISDGNDNDCALDDTGKRLICALGHDPVTIDTLVERTGLTAEKVSSILLALELEGCVTSAAGGLYNRTTGKP
jgi:DNA processing protein